MTAEDARLYVYDGINLRHCPTDGTAPKKHPFYLRVKNGAGIYGTVRMYGGIAGFLGDIPEHPFYRAALEKPDPLTFSAAYFDDPVKDAPKTCSVKDLPASKQRIPGLGDGCLQDILWQSKLHPKHRVKSLSDQEIETLYPMTQKVLGEMTAQGGRSTEKDLYGHPGGYGVLLSAKTLAQPCIRCGSPLVRKAYLGGNLYFCSRCQPEPGP